MELQIRTVASDELTEFCTATAIGFLRPLTDVQAEADARRGSMYWDRTWAAFDGDRMVSTLRSFPVQLTVPGGAAIDSSAVTAVTTTTTYRRQGLARRVVGAELRAARDRGEIAAVLHATEWPIYGRFGFGPATSECTLVVDATVARLRVPVVGRAELVDRETARSLLPGLYDAHRAASPGEISREARFHDIGLGIVRYPSWGEMKPGFHVVVRDVAGAVVGLARYEIEERWEHARPRNIVKVGLFVAANATGSALLWQHLVSLDLVSEIQVESRSVADPLPFLLTDGRHCREQDRADGLWVRLLDVPAALGARRYQGSGQLVLEVADQLDLAGGRFELTADGSASRCAVTDRPPQLSMQVGTLATAYLGGHRLQTLADAGLVEVHDPAALQLADALFGWHRPPWCTTRF